MLPSDLEIGSIKQETKNRMPQGHKQVGSDMNQCPFMKIQEKVPVQTQQSQPSLNKDGKPKKQKKQRGGCPLMSSESKRNPGLYHMKELYNTQFISIFNYLLDQRGLIQLAFDSRELNKGSIEERRKVFNKYPIYMKHTLFQDEENSKKMRQMEVAQRFFVYDKFREQGNKRLNKGEYEEAMKYYERALGCFKWLEYVQPPDTESEDEVDKKQDEQESESEEVNIDSDKDKIDPVEDKKNKDDLKQYKLEQKEIKKQKRSLLKIYTDDTVKQYDPSENKDEENDNQMVCSVIFTLYLNMAVCYMHMSHFYLARQVLEDATKIQENNSQLLFRKSQVLAYDDAASYEQLIESKQLIEKAIEISNYEKIFKEQPGILRLMNLQNALEMYVEQAHYVVQRIDKKKEWITMRVRALFERAKEIEEIELEMIEDGKIPFEDGVSNIIDEEDELQLMREQQQPEPMGPKQQETPKERLYRLCGPQLAEEQQEYSILVEMVNKYYRIIEFYTESRKPDQVLLAKRELQRIMATYEEMSFYMNLDLISYEDSEIIKALKSEINLNLKDKKIIRRILKLSREQVTEIFGKGHFNIEILDWAMKDYFKKKDEEQIRLNKDQQSQLPIKKQSWVQKQIFSWDFLISIMVFALLAGGYQYINGSKLFMNQGMKL